MWNWLKRTEKRQRDLERGVDADLLRDNRARWGLSFKLCVVGILLAAASYLPTLSWVQPSLRCIAIGCNLLGFILWKWARAEGTFLNKPDPEKPTKLFKF